MELIIGASDMVHTATHKETGALQTVTNQLSTTERRWFAVYTKYKGEKYVVDNLNKKGVIAYVPLIRQVKRYDRKIKESFLPLINCYVFVNILKSDYVKVLETEHVHCFIKQRKDLLAIPDEEINILKKVVGEIDSVRLPEVDFEPGMSVEIISGNLTGIKGTLIEQSGRKQFIVELETIGYQLALQVEESVLRPI